MQPQTILNEVGFMPKEVALWRVRCRAVWDFVYNIVATVLGIIGRVVWGIVDSLLSLFG